MAAETKTQYWDNPGAIAPFIDNAEKGCRELGKVYNIDHETCVAKADMVQAIKFGTPLEGIDLSQCRVYHLKDGDMVWTTQTNPNTGVSRAVYREVRFTYQTGLMKGQSLPPNHPKRRMITCTTGLSDGSYVALPDACNNWTIHWPQFKDDVEAVRLQQFQQFVLERQALLRNCQTVYEVTTPAQGHVLQIGEVRPCGNCGAVGQAVDIYFPGSKTTTSKRTCE